MTEEEHQKIISEEIERLSRDVHDVIRGSALMGTLNYGLLFYSPDNEFYVLIGNSGNQPECVMAMKKFINLTENENISFGGDVDPRKLDS